jgi:hypothetical protein
MLRHSTRAELEAFWRPFTDQAGPGGPGEGIQQLLECQLMAQSQYQERLASMGNHRDAARVLVASRASISTHPAAMRSTVEERLGVPPPHAAVFEKHISLGLGVVQRTSYESQNPMQRTSSHQTPTVNPLMRVRSASLSGAPSSAAPLSREESAHAFGEEPAEGGVST